MFQALPQICSLDRVDRLGNHASLGEDCPIDIPGLDDYVEFLLSSDTSANDLVIMDVDIAREKKAAFKKKNLN